MEPANQPPPNQPSNGDSDDAHETSLSPSPAELSVEELNSIRETVLGQDPELRRFSMWDLLVIVTAASLVLAVGTYLSRPVFAGIVGMATLLSMVTLSAMKHPPAALQVGWWILLLIYLMAIGSAVWN